MAAGDAGAYSPVGAVANELDGLEVALQGFPPGGGAGRSALNHAASEKGEGK